MAHAKQKNDYKSMSYGVSGGFFAPLSRGNELPFARQLLPAPRPIWYNAPDHGRGISRGRPEYGNPFGYQSVVNQARLSLADLEPERLA